MGLGLVPTSENEVNDEGAIGPWGTRVVKDSGVCLVKIFELVFLRDKSKNLFQKKN